MADDTKAGHGTQGGDQAGAASVSTPSGDDAAGGSRQSIDELLSENKKYRDQRRELKVALETAGKELEELRSFKADAERAKLSETERLQAERDDWQRKHDAVISKAKDVSLNSAIIGGLAKQGKQMLDPEVAITTMRSKFGDKLVFADDGFTVQGVDEAVQAFSAEYPWMFRDAATTASDKGLPGTSPAPAGAAKTLADYEPDEIRAMARNEPDKLRLLQAAARR